MAADDESEGGFEMALTALEQIDMADEDAEAV
jgi:hypothetical protein